MSPADAGRQRNNSPIAASLVKGAMKKVSNSDEHEVAQPHAGQRGNGPAVTKTTVTAARVNSPQRSNADLSYQTKNIHQTI